MLEPPNLDGPTLLTCLRTHYGLNAAEVTFLPLGADSHTAAYRVPTGDQGVYFLKLRSGEFEETSVTAPGYLTGQGVENVIAPIATVDRRPWADLEGYKVMLYPYVDGRSGFEVELSERQWREFGAALRRIHALPLPAELRGRLRVETYSPKWRDSLKGLLDRAQRAAYDEPTSAQLAAFLWIKREELLSLIDRVERLKVALRARPLEFVLCHSDIHAGNVLIGVNGDLYIVDWDNPILAPKERDLMFIGAGVGGVWNTDREAELFYRGYGQVEIDPPALAYYRYERIIEDIAVYAEGLLSTGAGGEDRERNLEFLASNFEPDGTLELASRLVGFRLP